MALTALYDLPAPAKLNLFLHVTGRRPDGYHLLQSIFMLIDWADTLHLESRADGQLHRHDLGPALPAEDLCLKAARALQAASGCSLGADISILKRVPWGAGLGGGSSDAATVLLGLNKLWRLGWPRERLLALAATLGADLPFFIGGQTAFVEGIGERLTPISLPEARWAVLKPTASIATPDIFSSRMLTRDTNAATVEGLLDDLFESKTRHKLIKLVGRNDLQAVAEALCPEVARARQWLESRFGNGRMTGSGSAVFALVSEYEGAGDSPVATEPSGFGFGSSMPAGFESGWVSRMCRSLPEHPLREWVN